MLPCPTHHDPVGRLADQLRLSSTLTPELMANVIAETCIWLPALSRALRADRIDRPVEVGAWTDAALALIELELPAWRLRRLLNEDGEWSCSLSSQPNLPAALDDTADARHAALPLAILSAFVEARRGTSPACGNSSQRRHVQPSLCFAVCCENFA
jgi:hypothetical protein